MQLRWVAADFKTGRILDDLRLPVDSIEQSVGQNSQVTARLNIHTAPPDWEILLDPARTMVAAIIDDHDAAGVVLRSVPVIGYRITRVDVAEDGINLGLASLEAVLDGVTVNDLEVYDLDESRVAEQILAQKVAPGWGFTVDVTDSGVVADARVYDSGDETTVAAALASLTAVEGGPEWTIRLGWATGDQRALTKRIVVAPRVGGDLPGVVVDDAVVTTRARSIDAGDGKFALIVNATADGLDSVTYVDTAAIAAGAPPWETTVQATVPDDDLEPEAYLDRTAARAYAIRRRGVTTWAVTLDASHAACPKVGVEFQAGDSIRMDLGPTWYDPAAWQDIARLTGWSATVVGGEIATITPVLYDDRNQEGT